MAGAATFSALREHQGVQPVKLEILSPRLSSRGVTFKVRATNLGGETIRSLRVGGLPTPRIRGYRGRHLDFFNLVAGKSQTLDWEAAWNTRQVAKGKRDYRMLALRGRPSLPGVRHPAFVFRYVGGDLVE